MGLFSWRRDTRQIKLQDESKVRSIATSICYTGLSHFDGSPQRLKEFSGHEDDGDDVDQHLPPVDLHEAKGEGGPVTIWMIQTLGSK